MNDGQGAVSLAANKVFTLLPNVGQATKANIFNGRELSAAVFLYDGNGRGPAGHCKVHAA